ncbi:MAG: D-glycerate dehydrogenase [Candidatus Nitrosopumilus limneticus]|nr:Glyoxylate reductase [Candidatus Nitrosopumilus limneticus]MDC4211699.1 D-glycerate dehydrogenase [Candidatus Nitrosopumilus limneticus]MDC4214593.1 D-glycerate dehydrogenase [Candidatus Nitrosopumilus limneticus]MDC4216435.1 D-glycerate dehydrogenase [Candidatus Nitrosopumilus limneticus]MDC4217767.1 D-glycerate dehydrogenase [Candidatus Nitrosopumilus limneticus]
MKEKIFLTRTLHDFALKELKKKFQIEIHKGKIPIPQNTLKLKIRDVNGLICFPYDKIDKEIIQSAKNLKVISTFSVGYDHIDIKFAKKKKIRVGYTPEVLTNATADMAFALLIDGLRRISEGDRLIRKGKWNQIYGAYDYVGLDLQGKTLGIIGLGRIGKTLAKRAKAFDMKIIYYNRKQISKTEEKKLGVKYIAFKKLISQADIISIHVPHTIETDQMFNMKIFKKMKKTSFLINTSRGKVVNEKELALALKQKIISGAGLDVFEKEPINKNHQFLKLENVVLAPHVGSSTKETRSKMAEITTKNLILGMSGKKPIYSIGY